MRKVGVNDEDLGTGVSENSILLKGAVFEAVGARQSTRSHYPDFSFIKYALKTLCRESGIVRDRRATVEVAALLMALVKEGVRCEAELVDRARRRWSEARIH